MTDDFRRSAAPLLDTRARPRRTIASALDILWGKNDGYETTPKIGVFINWLTFSM